MPIGFIIMQIGNEDLDRACASAIVPAIESAQLEAKRVDKHNQGGLLKSEIIGFLESADIIVADLTNERPNCYLEIGYAMGLDKFRSLILTAREDHYPDSPNYKKGGPKIHFDLIGYDILFWDPNDLDAFRDELSRRIQRRRVVLAPSIETPPSTWDTDWVEAQRAIAIPQLEATGQRGYLEARVALGPPKTSKNQTELDEAARTSTIQTFGWPIGVYLGNRDEYRPRPRADGIVATVGGPDLGTFDYWAWRRNGDFYLLKTIFEDRRDPTQLFFDTRIVRATELLLYCARFYARLEVDQTTPVHVALRHGGLRGRTIGAAGHRRLLRPRAPAYEDQVETIIETTLEGLESDLPALVKSLVAPVLVLFDFFELGDDTYNELVNSYVAGRI